MKNDTGRTLYTVSRKSLQRGKDEDVRVVPPHGNFDVNFCIDERNKPGEAKSGGYEYCGRPSCSSPLESLHRKDDG